MGPVGCLNCNRTSSSGHRPDRRFFRAEPGSRIDTDDFNGHGLLEGAYDHRSVDQEETYVTEDDVHCNTADKPLGALFQVFVAAKSELGFYGRRAGCRLASC